jgi:hypothetical protein
MTIVPHFVNGALRVLGPQENKGRRNGKGEAKTHTSQGEDNMQYSRGHEPLLRWAMEVRQTLLVVVKSPA